LTVPHEALHVEDGKPFVFKIVKDELVKVPVVVGTSSITLTPVLSGLQEGDEVATGSTSGLPLQAGVPVQVVQ
jgi:HlyD family secretion protein